MKKFLVILYGIFIITSCSNNNGISVGNIGGSGMIDISKSGGVNVQTPDININAGAAGIVVEGTGNTSVTANEEGTKDSNGTNVTEVGTNGSVKSSGVEIGSDGSVKLK